MCTECGKSRVLYAQRRISDQQAEELANQLDGLEYTCGSTFTDVDCEEGHVLSLVHVRQNLQCRTPVEVPYYSAKYTPTATTVGGRRT